MNTSLTDLFETQLETLMKQAGKQMLEGYAKMQSVKTERKQGNANFVTEYDVKIQHFLTENLATLLPQASFLAEEENLSTGSAGQGYTFVIDPIDGTANFMFGFGHSATSVGLLQDGKPVIGAVYNPFTDEYFFAKLGKGAFCNGKPIHVSDKSGDSAIVAFGTTPYSKESTGEQTTKLFHDLLMHFGDVRRMGAASLDLCYVAAGRADGFCEWSLSPWDYAAGALLVTEAGGTVTDFSGKEVPFDKPTSVVATNTEIEKELLRLAANIQ